MGPKNPRTKTVREWDPRTQEQTVREWDPRTQEQTVREWDPRTHESLVMVDSGASVNVSQVVRELQTGTV